MTSMHILQHFILITHINSNHTDALAQAETLLKSFHALTQVTVSIILVALFYLLHGESQGCGPPHFLELIKVVVYTPIACFKSFGIMAR